MSQRESFASPESVLCLPLLWMPLWTQSHRLGAEIPFPGTSSQFLSPEYLTIQSAWVSTKNISEYISKKVPSFLFPRPYLQHDVMFFLTYDRNSLCLSINHPISLFSFPFWGAGQGACPRHVEVPRAGIKPTPQQSFELLQWQCRILDSLHQGELLFPFPLICYQPGIFFFTSCISKDIPLWPKISMGHISSFLIGLSITPYRSSQDLAFAHLISILPPNFSFVLPPWEVMSSSESACTVSSITSCSPWA